MIETSRRQRLLAACLALCAGYVDAIGVLHSGGYFVSFMSGNTTNMAVGATAALQGAGVAALLIVLFVAGVVAASLAYGRLGQRHGPIILGAVAGGLALSALLDVAGARWLALWPMPVAMGALNTIFHRNGEATFGVTYMTGALVKLGQNIARAIRREPDPMWFPYLLLWLSLALGALLGALIFASMGLQAIWIAVIAFAGMAFAESRRP